MFDTLRSALRGASQRARHRRQYRHLVSLDRHLLRDIGVEPDQIRALMRR